MHKYLSSLCCCRFVVEGAPHLYALWKHCLVQPITAPGKSSARWAQRGFEVALELHTYEMTLAQGSRHTSKGPSEWIYTETESYSDIHKKL